MVPTVKCLSAMLETRVWSLGWEDPPGEGIATHSSILAWKIPWTEEPGRLQSMGLQRVGNDWATWLYFHKPSTKRKQQKPNLAHLKTDGWMATDLAVMRKLKPQSAAGKDKKQPGCASECDLFWRHGPYRGNRVKMRSLGWALIQYDWCP